MARTREGALLTQLHRRQQLTLRAQVIRDVMRLYGLWDLHDPDSWVAFEDAMVALAQLRSGQSAALAARYYELFRAVDAPGPAARLASAVPLAAPPVEEQIRKAVTATAQGGVYRAFGAGQSHEQATKNGLVAVSGTLSRLALQGGRDTIVDEVQRDRVALGYARVTADDPCAFCAMLASRGPVYGAGTVEFEAHDHCACFGEPVYEGSQWPGRSKEFDSLWRDVATDLGHAPTLNDFRRAYEGRTG